MPSGVVFKLLNMVGTLEDLVEVWDAFTRDSELTKSAPGLSRDQGEALPCVRHWEIHTEEERCKIYWRSRIL